MVLEVRRCLMARLALALVLPCEGELEFPRSSARLPLSSQADSSRLQVPQDYYVPLDRTIHRGSQLRESLSLSRATPEQRTEVSPRLQQSRASRTLLLLRDAPLDRQSSAEHTTNAGKSTSNLDRGGASLTQLSCLRHKGDGNRRRGCSCPLL